MKIRLKMDDITALLNGNEVLVRHSDANFHELPIEVVIDEPMNTFYSRLAKKMLIPEYFMDQFRDKIKQL